MSFTLKEGEYLIGLARSSISYYLKNLVPLEPLKMRHSSKKVDIAASQRMFPNLLEKRGVFCTLLTYPDNKLRGCIGLIEPNKSLIDAVVEVSCSATQDPRFLPLKEEELNKIVIELTILSEMQKILVYEPRDYLKEIKIGQDGLFLKYHYNTGVFLPQVPVEQNWDVKAYLSELCKKAGLQKDAWIMKPIKLYKFQAQIFSEAEPDGRVFERKLNT